MLEGGPALECVRCHAAVPAEAPECLRCGGPGAPLAWSHVPVQQAPPGWMQPLRGLGTAVVSLLAVTMVLDAVTAVVDVQRVGLFGRLARGELVTDAEASRSDDLVQGLAGLQLLLLVGTAAVLIAWLHRAYQNAGRLGSALPHEPGWTIGAWFVPFLNLVRPKQLVDQAWQASDPQLEHHRDAHAWRHAPRTPLVTLWWALWIATTGVTQAGGALGRSEDAGDLAVSARWDVAADVTDGLAAVVLLVLVRRLTARQSQRLASAGS